MEIEYDMQRTARESMNKCVGSVYVFSGAYFRLTPMEAIYVSEKNIYSCFIEGALQQLGINLENVALHTNERVFGRICVRY